MATIKRDFRDFVRLDFSGPLWLTQAARFFSVGMLNTALDLCLYTLLTTGLGISTNWRVAVKSITYGAGILNSFYWNKTWTFQAQSRPWAMFVPFMLTNLVGLAINAGGLALGLQVFHLPEIIALGLATVGSLTWNFILSKFVVFRS
ncbi:MAG: GtrA family protein [Chloroflexi bacterium]|nr:GtrA family protein [Chloroflexota bacterium]